MIITKKKKKKKKLKKKKKKKKKKDYTSCIFNFFLNPTLRFCVKNWSKKYE